MGQMFASEASVSDWIDYDVLPFANAHSCSSWHQFSRLAAVVAILFATVKGDSRVVFRSKYSAWSLQQGDMGSFCMRQLQQSLADIPGLVKRATPGCPTNT